LVRPNAHSGFGILQRFQIPLHLLGWRRFLFEGGINSDVPDGNSQTIVCGESFDELNLLFTECRVWRPNVPEFVVVHHTISAHTDPMVNPIAEFLFRVIHGAILLEKFSFRRSNLGSQITGELELEFRLTPQAIECLGN
jgi:hypothetical protein